MYFPFLLYPFVFVFGTIIGSFLNSVIFRLQPDESFSAPRSFCPHCRHQLSWKDLIPLLSFLLLAGKCRYCRKPISIQYPLVEIATGLLFLLIFNFTIYLLPFINYYLLLNAYYFLISCFLIIIFVYDLKHYIIPDKIIYPAIATSIIFNFVIFPASIFFASGKEHLTNFLIFNFHSFILSALGAAGFFLAIVLLTRGKGMGIGDIKLAFLMGLFLGWMDILVALFVAFFSGAIIGIGLILLKKKKMKSEVPFGPFLVAGTFIALFWGQTIINLYLGL
ncbi:MAG: prepilin peptidase [Candidatus Nealsonbacteria bacterium CG23_combo_of_CG06-09_8_20_14_all_39_17]|uniref:Prepilin peptidase n=1 Tax=Candidatus Nealsonbacteria bacterium CG23_combo_of_CG06-09_8_20_14_all_39_17 TaxID=1974722 RepID=A0A2G9YTX3_9BACT|nr:MAG: prepilin peptidase [Candidatus Nealsonbacteria bacterium CG23_combo_of_CG06-09_8_20_14_all_39_17]